MALCSTASASVRSFEGLTGLSGSGPSYLMPSQRGLSPLVLVALNSAFTTSDLSPFSACKGIWTHEFWRGPGRTCMLHGGQAATGHRGCSNRYAGPRREQLVRFGRDLLRPL